jgi:prepilin-type N-terminal cleavage/methylation domain-containing protein/prepilin-type processing-associated H-X9-DG protein
MSSTTQRSVTSAFTLMELLIAITIIGALATLTVPATQRVVARSRASHCLNNLRNLGSALNLYLAEHNNTMPTLVTARASKGSDEQAIENTLDAYTGSHEVFHCLADDKHLFETTGSSYQWNNLLNGQNVASMDLMGFIKDGAQIPVMYDKEGFHKYQQVKTNILYADGHAANQLEFVASEGK